MADTFSKAERSRIMALVKSKGTTPEMIVRRLVHGMGYRYRLHGKGLPGTPDLVFAGRRKVIEVRGCFWHGHSCGRCRVPATRRDYWVAKIERNRRRDARNQRKLRELGWGVLIVWECQAPAPGRGDLEKLRRRVEGFLGG